MMKPNAGEETFISHLIELRDRLVKASIGIALVCVALMIWPGPSQIYDFIARPMIASLPVGSKMIATGVISPFLVPMKVTLVISIILSLPWVLYQLWAFVAPGLYAHEKRLIAPLVISSSLLFMSGVAFCYFLVFGRVFQFIAAVDRGDAGYRELSGFRDVDVPGVWRDLRSAGGGGDPGAHGAGQRGQAEGDSSLRHRRRVCHRGDCYTARCGQHVLAGDSDVPAVRTGPAGGATVRAHLHGPGRKSLTWPAMVAG
jgi:hypothetical protein